MAVESEAVAVGRGKQKEEQKHFHVLAVDDSVIDRKLLERLLTVSSCKVTCVDSGDKALKFLGLLDDLQNISASSTSLSPSSSSPDQSPQHEGSPWKDIPVVIMSSENVPSRISMCLEGGAEEFLLKPLQLSDLKKLQPYFLKFPDNSCLAESIATDNDSNQKDNCNNISKRKATSPEPRERSRSKMKELKVV
ncbi:two-component response regulator ORR4-like isoform X2 [Prosopis cineraria]|uniref:two-component response regulator ORR4-like isoform X2 n=1 Tax=Prosopis cineraria TaxID=364024 RepID=UPI00240F50C2|nr:two-component response regulator ORR4-like isoform X2 [Prosopis cineraria]